MKLTREKKIKHLYIKKFIIYCMIIFLFNCSKSIEQQLIGVWEIKYVKWDNSDSMEVPHYDRYQLSLERSNGSFIFHDDMQNGNWSFFDSTIFLTSTPICTTYIDSLFLVNDELGNSSLILKNGEQKLGELTVDGVVPERITYEMELLAISDTVLKLSSEGNTYIYKKIR